MFRHPFSFNGRIRRTELWLTYVIYIFGLFGTGLVFAIITGGEDFPDLVYYVISFPWIWLLLAQNSKRCHDIGLSGWFQLIPILNPFALLFVPSSSQQNQFGPNPKQSSVS